MKYLLALCGCLASCALLHAQSAVPVAAPTWPQVVQVIERLTASNSVADVQQVLRANAAIVMSPGADPLFAQALQGSQLTADQRVLVSLAQETFRDARAAGLDLAAETLGVRVTILELLAAPAPADARAVLIKRRDVTASPLLGAAFERLRTQPGADPQAMQELATAFREANQSVDVALNRLLRMAGASGATGTPGPAAPGTGAPATAGGGGAAASPLAGHWRCTTIAGSGDASITTDHHMVLNPDGTYRSWEHSFISFSGRENTTAAETGRWVVRGTAIVFTGTDGGTLSVPFQRSGDTILLPNESTRRIWERVR